MAPQVSRDTDGRMSSTLEASPGGETMSLESSDEISSEELISSSSPEDSESYTPSDSESTELVDFVEQWLCTVYPGSPMTTNRAIYERIHSFNGLDYNYELRTQPPSLLEETDGENEDTDGDSNASEAQVNERNWFFNDGTGIGTRILTEAAAASAREDPLVVMTAVGPTLNDILLRSPFLRPAVLPTQTPSNPPPFAPINLPASALPADVALQPFDSIGEAALPPPRHPRPTLIRRNAVNINRGLFNLPPPLYTLLPPYESIAAEIEIQRPFREYRAALRRGYEQKLRELRAERDADLANADPRAAEGRFILLPYGHQWSPSIFAPFAERGDPFAELVEEHTTLGRFRREVELWHPDTVRTITERFESRLLDPFRAEESPLSRRQEILRDHLYDRRAAEAAEIDALWDSARLAHVSDELEWEAEVEKRQLRRERERNWRNWMERRSRVEEDEVEITMRKIHGIAPIRSGRVDGELETRGRTNVRTGEKAQSRQVDGRRCDAAQAGNESSSSDSSPSSTHCDTPPAAEEIPFKPAERGTFAARLKRLVNNLSHGHQPSPRRTRILRPEPKITDTERFPDFEPTLRYTRTSTHAEIGSRQQQNHVDALPTYEEVVEEQNAENIVVTVEEVVGVSPQCSDSETVTCPSTEQGNGGDESKSVGLLGVEEMICVDTLLSQPEKEVVDGEVDTDAVVSGEQTWEWMGTRGDGDGEGGEVEEYPNVEYIEHVGEDLGDLYSADG